MVSRSKGQANDPPRLSRRGLDVLALLAAGRTVKEIADRLGIEQRTVKWHIANAVRKLNAANRTQAVAIAVELKIVRVSGTVDAPL